MSSLQVAATESSRNVDANGIRKHRFRSQVDFCTFALHYESLDVLSLPWFSERFWMSERNRERVISNTGRLESNTRDSNSKGSQSILWWIQESKPWLPHHTQSINWDALDQKNRNPGRIVTAEVEYERAFPFHQSRSWKSCLYWILMLILQARRLQRVAFVPPRRFPRRTCLSLNRFPPPIFVGNMDYVERNCAWWPRT